MKIIHLDSDEELTAAVDKIIEAEDQDISLVVPAGAQIIQSAVSLRLLKREASNSEKNVTIITPDEFGRQLAAQADFVVKQKIDPQDVEETPQNVSEEPVGDDLGSTPEPEPESQDDEMNTEYQVKLTSHKEKPQKEPDQDNDIIDALVEEFEADEKIEAKKAAAGSSSTASKNESQKQSMWKKSEEKEFGPEIVDVPIEKKRGRKKQQVENEIYEPNLLEDDLDILDERPAGKSQSNKKTNKQSSVLKKILSGKITIAAVAVFAVFAGWLLLFVLPKVEVTIYPQTERLKFPLEVTGSEEVSSIDTNKNIIPIQIVTVEENLTKEFSASGQKEVNKRASGIIKVYNEYSTDPQPLVASTRFLSSEGKLFRTTQPVTIPGAKVEEGKIVPSFTEVEVRADQPGDEYNIESSNFTIPGFEGTAKYAAFYGESEEAMTGGAMGLVKVVTKEDINKAKESIKAELEAKIANSLKGQAPENLKPIEGAVSDVETEVDCQAEEDDAQDNFEVKTTGQAQAMFFDEGLLSQLVNKKIIEQIENHKTPLVDSQKIIWDKPEVNWEEETVDLSLSVQEDISCEINKDEIKQQLAGLNKEAAKEYLGQIKNIREVEAIFWPFWINSVPDDSEKIQIEIK